MKLNDGTPEPSALLWEKKFDPGPRAWGAFPNRGEECTSGVRRGSYPSGRRLALPAAKGGKRGMITDRKPRKGRASKNCRTRVKSENRRVPESHFARATRDRLPIFISVGRFRSARTSLFPGSTSNSSRVTIHDSIINGNGTFPSPVRLRWRKETPPMGKIPRLGLRRNFSVAAKSNFRGILSLFKNYFPDVFFSFSPNLF